MRRSTTPPPAVRSALRHALRALRHLEARLERSVRPTLPTDRLSLSVVDDPTGRLRLIGVRGPLNAETMAQFALALDGVPEAGAVHLDVTDATIAGPTTLDQLERLIDRLELRGVRIRIVGLDPLHPVGH